VRRPFRPLTRVRRHERRSAVPLLLLVAFFACASPSTVPPAHHGERIVALAPSITEIVYALGAGSRLVGVCAQCDYPEAARAVARVGGYLAPSVEAVLGTEPDLVLAVPSPGNRETVRALERTGRRVLVVQDRTLGDLWDAIRAIADALGEPAAGEALATSIRARLDEVRGRVRALPTRRVLLVVGHSPLIVAGGGTLQDELLSVAGGANVAADVGAAWPQISLELVVARAPEVIVDAAMGTEQGGRDLFAALHTVPAVREGRIIPVRERGALDELFRAGPRVSDAAAALAEAIHPEAFPGTTS